MEAIVRFFIAFTLILNLHSLAAQVLHEQGAPFITNYKSGEDILDSQYWCAIEDQQGIMYFGTGEGIVEFDGVEYKLIETPTKTVIRTLCITSDGVIYGGGDNSFGYLAPNSKGETVFVSLTDKLKQRSPAFSSVTKTFYADNCVWILTDNAGVFKLTNDSITTLPIDLISRYGSIAYDKVFIFQHDRGIFTVENDQPVYLPHTHDFTKDDVGKIELLPFGRNKLLIVTKNKGLYLYHYDQLVKAQRPYSEESIPSSIAEKFSTAIEDYLIQNIVYPCARIDSTQYAFGTLLGGIITINEHGDLVRVINENRGLYDNVIYGLYTDRSKNLWALMNNGVAYIEMVSSLSSFNRDNKPGKFLFQAKKHQGKLYLAHDKGISYLPDYALKVENDDQPFAPVNGIKGRVDNFCSYKDILLCEADSKLYAIYKDKAKVIGDIPAGSEIVSSSAFDKCFFYCSPSNAGYFKISYRTPNKTSSSTDFPDVKLIVLKSFDDVPLNNSIVQDPNGNILLYSVYSNGLCHIKFRDHSIDDYKIIRYDAPDDVPDLKPSGFILYQNKLFIGSSHGLLQATTFPSNSNCCDSITGFVPETYFGGILGDPSINIYDGAVGPDGKLWLSTNKGFGFIASEKNGSFSFVEVPLHGITPASVNIDNDGNHWITSKGVLYRFDPLTKDRLVEFDVLIRRITVGNDSVMFHGAFFKPSKTPNGDLVNAKQEAEEVTNAFEFSNNAIKFECAATSYEAADNNRYSYFMEGVDKSWSEWSPKSKKEYSYLPVGEYTFRVKAMNVHGEESEVASYKFQILPPWYKTAIAYWCYIGLGVLIITGSVRLYVNHLIQSKRRLEKIIDQRTSEIREKNIQLSNTVQELQELQHFKESMIHMIVHDLKNPLNTIIGYGQEKQISNMSSFILHSGKTMLNMVENILNVHKFEQTKIKLKVETYNIKRVIEEAIQEVSFIACERKIRIIDKTDRQSFLFDVELIKRVLVNLLTNAIKFSKDNDEVIITSGFINDESKSRVMRIEIHDHGIGIPPDMTGKIFDKYVQVEARKLGIAHSTGLGLTFCKLVIEAHKGKIGVESKAGNGSAFYFHLPLAGVNEKETIQRE